MKESEWVNLRWCVSADLGTFNAIVNSQTPCLNCVEFANQKEVNYVELIQHAHTQTSLYTCTTSTTRILPYHVIPLSACIFIGASSSTTLQAALTILSLFFFNARPVSYARSNPLLNIIDVHVVLFYLLALPLKDVLLDKHHVSICWICTLSLILGGDWWTASGFTRLLTCYPFKSSLKCLAYPPSCKAP